MIKLSGAIGITILSRNINDKIKKIYIFADNHNKDKYCSLNFNSSNNIKKFLEKKKHTSQILLEEVKRSESLKLKELWPSNVHTSELKEFYLDNKNKITPIDIRQYLYLISWEVLDPLKESDKQLTFKQYLFNFDNFFNLKDVIPSLKDKLKNVKFKNIGICKYFKKLKKKYFEIIKDFNLDQKILETENRSNILNKIDDLASKIMDWYTIICIFNSYKITYLHAGLYHTSNIINILVSDFHFNINYENGDTKMNNRSDNDSCVEIIETKPIKNPIIQTIISFFN